jgi:hypothetical protein
MGKKNKKRAGGIVVVLLCIWISQFMGFYAKAAEYSCAELSGMNPACGDYVWIGCEAASVYPNPLDCSFTCVTQNIQVTKECGRPDN